MFSRFRPFLLITMAFLYIFAGQSFAQSQLHITVENVHIRYDQGQQASAENVRKLLIHHLARFNDFFGEKPDSLLIDLVFGKSHWQEYRRRGAPEWAKGLFFPGENLIVINLTGSGTPLNKLESVTLHELSHAYFHEAFGNSGAPVWFNEGLAEYLSGGIYDMDPLLLANAQATGNLPALEELQDMHSFPTNKAALAYVQCLSAVQYIFRELGDLQPRFLQMLKTHDWQTALAQYLQTDDIGLEIDWYADVKERYGWLVIFNLENLIWLAAALLIIVAFFWKMIRNRRKMRQWERESPPQDPPSPEMLP